jgi:hypothetical protein
MTVSYNQTTINLRLTDVLNQISTGALILMDASGNALATLPIGSLSVAFGVLSFGITSASVAQIGLATQAKITGVSGVPVTSLTVSSIAGSDIVITPSAQLFPGNQVTLTAGQITGR